VWSVIARLVRRPLRAWDAAPAAPFAVACACGRVARGARGPRRQVVSCPACGRPVFVLAASPLPPDPAAVPPGGWRAWRLPLLAAAGTVAALALLFVALLPLLSRAPPDDAPDVGAEIDEGQKALGQRAFHSAREKLDRAVELSRRRPDALTPDRRRALLQLRRQADLLERLSVGSLEEVVREAALQERNPPAEWQARYDRDYRGRTVVFDDVVKRDAAGRPVLSYYEVRVDGRPVRLGLEDLKVLAGLPLEKPRRMLFGARLGGDDRRPGVAREDGGGWVVHFDPDGGVLLTDPEAAAACLPGPVDAGVREVLDWQRRQLSR
jgi:hypothetical protein